MTNFNVAIVEVQEWTKFTLHFTERVITHPCLDYSRPMLVKGGPFDFVVTMTTFNSSTISIHVRWLPLKFIYSFGPGRCDYILKLVAVKLMWRIAILNISYEIALSKCYNTSLMISQHWSDYSWVPSGIKPLIAPMLTQFYLTIWCHNAAMIYYVSWRLSQISLANLIHDDVIKWKHFPRYWPFVRGIHRSPVNSPHKSQWCGALMFSLICTRINGWLNNGEAGDLRCRRAHHDVTAMLRSIAMYEVLCEYLL